MMHIPYKQVFGQFANPVRGIIYVGSGLGSQIRIFSDSKVDRMLWVEKEKNGLPNLYEQTKKYPLRQQYLIQTLSNKNVDNECMRFETLYKANRAMIPLEDFQLVILDLEDRSELAALEGFLPLLTMYSNIKGFYMKTRGVGDIEQMLAPFGFKKTLESVNDIGWGEVLFVRG